eukprot:GILK01008313.1.p1 GENE.GILK01008313.1~~GILK01008313.1.p1  ORF type:complete len:344 (-),score=23.38 GILK01008313.1:181-1212(-)
MSLQVNGVIIRRRDLFAATYFCIAFACVFVFCGGVIILVSAGNMTREKNVKLYNSAVDEWSSHERQHFQNMSISLVAVTADGKRGEAVLSTNTSIALLDPTALEFSPYDRFYFYLNSSQANYLFPSSVPFAESQNISFVFRLDHLTAAGPTSTSLDIRLPLFEKRQVHNEGEGVCKKIAGGLWEKSSRLCTTYWYLSSLCLKVKEVNISEHWAFSDLYGGIGCGIPDWTPAVYTQINVTEDQVTHKRYTQPIALSHFKTTVRYEKDPFVVAVFITGKSLNFGASTSVKLCIGSGMIVLAVAVMYYPVVFFWSIFKNPYSAIGTSFRFEKRGSQRTIMEDEWWE